MAVIYVDDLLIASSTIDEHCDHLRTIFGKLRENGLTVKLKKSERLKHTIEFLGYKISEGGIAVDENKVKAIRDFPTPRNAKQLQSFLGLCNYYRKFQKNYSGLTGGLAHIMTKKGIWEWRDREKEIFKQIKVRFLDTIMLKHRNFKRPFKNRRVRHSIGG